MKILIAVDGSIYGDEAVETIGKTIKDAEIKIVTVYETPLLAVSTPYALPVGIDPALEKEIKNSARETVARAEEKLRDSFPDAARVLTTEVLCGSPQRAIIEEAEKWGADLIVTGSHGYGFWERMFLGSVSNAIVHHAPCSVLVVRKPKSGKTLENEKVQ